MTHQIKGVISSSSTKTVRTKFGDKPTYQYVVDGVEFSSGFKKEHNEGEMVTIGVQFKYGEWQKIPGSTGDGMPAATANQGGGGQVTSGNFTPKSRGTFPVDPMDGQMSIIRQNSMNRAVEIMDQWLSHDLLDTSERTKEGYIKKLHEMAMIITDFNSGQDIMNLKKAMQANLKVAK